MRRAFFVSMEISPCSDVPSVALALVEVAHGFVKSMSGAKVTMEWVSLGINPEPGDSVIVV
jgi:hypothetical protein